MNGLVTMPVSPEQIAAQVELAATDVLLEEELASRDVPATVETVATLTDSMIGRPGAIGGVPGILKADEQVAFVADVQEKASSLWTDVRTWLKNVFRSATDKLTELAKKLLDISQKLGVTVEHLISRLYRRVMRSLIESSVLAPFVISERGQTVNVNPSELTFSFTLKAAPALASLDVSGVVKLLSGLMEMQLSVQTKYRVGTS